MGVVLWIFPELPADYNDEENDKKVRKGVEIEVAECEDRMSVELIGVA
jgi:hypothetical protein